MTASGKNFSVRNAVISKTHHKSVSTIFLFLALFCTSNNPKKQSENKSIISRMDGNKSGIWSNHAEQ